MAVRIRETGEIVCAALHPALPGDQYVHDGVHYELAQHQVIVTEAEPAHSSHGLWWWRGEQPAWAEIEDRDAAERPALLREMSRHEVEAVVLRLMAREPKRGWWARIWEWVWRTR